MNIVRFEEGDGAPPLMPEDWRALHTAGWIVDWALPTAPAMQLAILCGRDSAAYAAYYPTQSAQRAADSWRAALPSQPVPDFGSAPLPKHLAARCPEVVPRRFVVDVTAPAVLREMRDGEIASLVARLASDVFGWVADALRERGCSKSNLVKGDIARAVRKTVWLHMQGAAGAQCPSSGEKGNG